MDPSLAHEILVTNFNKFMDNDFGEFINKDVDPILGANPFFLNGHDWKDRRNEATPAFTTARVSLNLDPVELPVVVKSE